MQLAKRNRLSQRGSNVRQRNRFSMQCLTQAMQTDLEISSTQLQTIDETSLKELNRLKQHEYVPLACRIVVRIDVTLFESSKPELNWGSRVTVWRTKDYVQSQILIARTTLVRLVIGCLYKSQYLVTLSACLPRPIRTQLSSASLQTLW